MRVLAIAVVLGLAASVLLAEGEPAFPERLSGTGLYTAAGEIDPANLPFAPQYPLWSDGATKSRWIRLPDDTRIDVSDVDLWRFPEGTKIWKEFAWGGRKVETRMLWKVGGEWRFAAYAWNEAQTDALLAPPSGVPDVHEIAPGVRHAIPGTDDCRSCHGSSPGTVLGFNALQLSDDRDPLAPHAEPLRPGDVTLRSLLDLDLLHPRREELGTDPPRIRDRDPVARAAVGYLAANCGGCHNAAGPLARVGLDLTSVESVHASALDAPGRWVVPGQAADTSRSIAPGAPERSAIVYRMGSRRPSSQMPPLGTQVVDEEALALVKRWVEGTGARSVTK
jgi:hypothetical protein